MWLKVRFISRILTLPVSPVGFHQNENLMPGKNSLLFHIDLRDGLFPFWRALMFRPDIPGKHRDCSNNPVGKLRDGSEDGFYFSSLFCQLVEIWQRHPLSQWDVWGKTIILFSFFFPERRMEGGVGPELCPMWSAVCFCPWSQGRDWAEIACLNSCCQCLRLNRWNLSWLWQTWYPHSFINSTNSHWQSLVSATF